ncbi:MAG: hypothetical protein Q4A21_00110 [bacterium]|nr:hypothetical protein [bacterium]
MRVFENINIREILHSVKEAIKKSFDEFLRDPKAFSVETADKAGQLILKAMDDEIPPYATSYQVAKAIRFNYLEWIFWIQEDGYAANPEIYLVLPHGASARESMISLEKFLKRRKFNIERCGFNRYKISNGNIERFLTLSTYSEVKALRKNLKNFYEIL